MKAHILAGDIYQANLTFPPRCRSPAIRSRSMPRCASGRGPAMARIVFTGTHWLLSLSPELFFTLEGGTVTTRPMKGTAPRGADPDALRADPKQRAENLMIVDLLRNDLSRVAEAGHASRCRSCSRSRPIRPSCR